MKRSIRRYQWRLERQFSRVQSRALNYYNRNFGSRFRASFSSPHVPTHSDSDLDLTDINPSNFRSIDSNQSHGTDEPSPSSDSLIPCEICHQMFSVNGLNRHQIRCQLRRQREEQPARRSRQNRVDEASELQENVTLPSAPPRSRSESPVEDYEAPENLSCPITRQLFHNATIATDGHTYELEAIKRWIREKGTSPITREPLRPGGLIANRLVQKMADEYREQQRATRAVLRYRLYIDCRKGPEIENIPCYNSKKSFQVEWLKTHLNLNNENSILVHLFGAKSEELAKIYRTLPSYPNLLSIYGQVEQKEDGYLFVQESNQNRNLRSFLKENPKREVLDEIFWQICAFFEFLSSHKVFYGSLNLDEIFVENRGDNSSDILVRLGNVSNYLLLNRDELNNDEKLAPEFVENGIYSEKSDVFVLGQFGKEIYTEEQLDDQRQILFQNCCNKNVSLRPTISEIKQQASNLNFL